MYRRHVVGDALQAEQIFRGRRREHHETSPLRVGLLAPGELRLPRLEDGEHHVFFACAGWEGRLHQADRFRFVLSVRAWDEDSQGCGHTVQRCAGARHGAGAVRPEVRRLERWGRDVHHTFWPVPLPRQDEGRVAESHPQGSGQLQGQVLAEGVEGSQDVVSGASAKEGREQVRGDRGAGASLARQLIDFAEHQHHGGHRRYDGSLPDAQHAPESSHHRLGLASERRGHTAFAADLRGPRSRRQWAHHGGGVKGSIRASWREHSPRLLLLAAGDRRERYHRVHRVPGRCA
mmetsp:Transcript_26830/g.77569  ORF Transcript_26830/g.77569 Transcript_26830/m.77569 type:complete len:290 (+) Transcript_26830:492-1361(+)